MLETKGGGVSYLNIDTEGVVTLATLGAGQQSALGTLPETPTHQTHVLKTQRHQTPNRHTFISHIYQAQSLHKAKPEA